MGLIAYRSRATLRRRWRSYLGVALLLGITGGLSLTAIAGARRTQSALPRFLDAVDASTMSTNAGPYDPAFEAAVAALPQVRRSAADLAFNVAPLVDGQPDFDRAVSALSSLDGRYLGQDRFTPTQGRGPDPDRIDEVAVNELAAERFGYRVGQRIELGTYSDEQLEDPGFFTHPAPPVLRMTATVVGIGLFPDEVVQDDIDRDGRLLLSQAYAEEAVPYTSYSWQGLVLAGGDADVEAVKRQILDLPPPEGSAMFRVTSVDEFHGLQAVRPLSLALGVFGVIAGVAGLVLVGQALTRALRLERAERAVLRALGAAPVTSTGAALVGPLAAIVGGTALAVALAVATSPAMPIGPVRRVEVREGVDIDLTVLGLGALGTVVALSVLVVVVAWLESPQRVERRQAATGRPSRLSAAATAAGLGPAAVFGLRSAFEPGRSVTAVPVRSVLAGAVVSVVALVGAVTFGASLDSLLAQPRLYGWDWDATIFDTGGYGDINLDKASAVLDHDPQVAAWSGAFFSSDSLDGRNVPLLAMEPGSEVFPPLLEGRSTDSTDEIVLGSATAGELGKHVGDTVVLGGRGQQELRVVGIATLPTVGALLAAHPSLGVGAIVSPELVFRFNTGPAALFVRFRPGTDAAAERAHLGETTGSIGEFPGGSEVLAAQRPAEIVNAGDVGGAPALLAGLLALGALGSLALALGTSVRRRRRDLALLKTLGFSRRQVGATVAWQASATVLAGLVLGVPLGVVLGRQLWNVFTAQLDVVPEASVPLLTLLGLTVAGIVVANVVAAIPAGAARRVPASLLLRSE